MSENDDAVLTAAVGYVYHNAPGAAYPTAAQLKTLDLTNPLSWGGLLNTWKSVGHTSRGTLPEFGFEGGDSEVKGSWQKKKLREITAEDPIDFLTVVLHQFDEASLELYLGENASDEAGIFEYGGLTTNERAGLVIIEDGDFRIGHHFHRAGTKRDASIELPIDDLAALPIRFTYLDFEDKKLFRWINEDLFNVDAVLPHLALGGATGGNFTLLVNDAPTATIAISGISATTIKNAIVALDDGISAADVTVTAAGGGYDIDIPAELGLGTDSTTGGSGVVLS